MPKQEFIGRAIISGQTDGSCLVKRNGFNVLNNFTSPSRPLNLRVLCLPAVVGSTTGGMLLQSMIESGTAPRALLFSKKIDSLAATGIILAQVWNQKKLIAIDQLGDDFLEKVRDGDRVIIDGNKVLV